MQRDECNRWMRRQLFPQDEGERARRFTLHAVTIGKKVGDQIATFKAPKVPDDDWILATLNEIESGAKSDASGLTVPMQTYVVFAYSDASEKPSARWTFREVCSDLEDDGEMSSEPPTKGGIMAQQMRHNEKIMATAMTMVTQTLSYYQRTNSRLSEALEKAIDERLSTVDLVERLRSDDFGRRLEAKKDEERVVQTHEIFEMVKNLAPVVVHKLTGHSMPGMKSDKDGVVDALVESITPEQIEELQKTLRPDQLMLVLTLMEAKQKEEQAKEAAKAEKRNGTVEVLPPEKHTERKV